ncbi:MAG: hypothetical protein A2017_02855 [Lentisphaerae bacterium GWF2_44_16]|nr:MAG: hypothetical protein A2017_02855 [Lentisphaerae bacterium GWF2_44_16]
MCTWAGYIGEKDACRTLVEMGKKVEGIWSGFYSGIVTLDDKGFHYDKVIGNINCLEEKGIISGFTGNIGLFHSRTNSGGGSEWAQPFVIPEKTLAVVGQGSRGFFSDEPIIESGNRMLDLGRYFTSSAKPCGRYPLLNDGKEAHVTEIITQAIAVEYETCGNHTDAICRILAKLPLESVFIFIFKDDPRSIYLGNINQRIVIGKDASGTYLGTSSLAFPESTNWLTEIPGNTVAKVSMDGIELKTLSWEKKLQPEEQFPYGIEQAFFEYVAENPGCFLAEIVDNALKPLFNGKKLQRRAVAGYQTMERLLKAEKIYLKTLEIPGVNESAPAVRTCFYCQ